MQWSYVEFLLQSVHDNLGQKMVPASTPSVDSPPAFSSASVEGSSNLCPSDPELYTI